MKEYKLYLFDFDGTLADTFESLINIFDYSFRKVGITNFDKSQISIFARYPLSETIKIMGIKEQDVPAFINAINESLDFEENIKTIKLFPKTLEVIETLKAKRAGTGIVSSNNSSHIWAILKNLECDQFFDVVIGNELYSKMKPDGEPVEVALSKFNFKKEDCVYIGDSINDFKAGQNAGIDSYLLDRFNEYPEIKENKLFSLFELLCSW